MREVAVSGEGIRFAFRVTGYERPALEGGDDANWLVADAELIFLAEGRFVARRSVALRTEEVEAFRDALRHVVENLDGQATLTHLEDEIGCTVRLNGGRGEVDAFLRQHVPGVRIQAEQVPTDQSFLSETVRQLDALVAEFPVKP
jgi:hypothetical protein